MMTREMRRIRYRTYGGGETKVVLLHGGMQTAANFRKLATVLQDQFTVYVPDRRHGDLDEEIRDLDVLLQQTGARNVFGLSSGATIALRAALELPAIARLALYEPPLKYGDIDPVAWLPRFEKELAAGRTAAAFATVTNGTGDRQIPRPVLMSMARLAVPAGLVATMRGDGRAVAQAAGPLETYAAVTAETLLLGGERSSAYLRMTLNALEPVLPRVRRVTLPKVGHLAADNIGRPRLVALHLRAFFG